MDECRARLDDELCVFAETQTAGRGQAGKCWSSNVGDGIYFTYGRRCKMEIQALSLTVGVYLARLLQEKGISCALKWPNDLYVDGLKLGGILIEVDSSTVLVGVGLNLRKPEGLPAIGLQNLGVNELNISSQAAHEVKRAVSFHLEYGFEVIREEYEQQLLWKGDKVSIAGKIGKLEGITSDGCLVVSGESFLSGSCQRVC